MIAPHAIETRVSNKLSHGVTSYVGVVQAPGCYSTAGAAWVVTILATSDRFHGCAWALDQPT